MEKDGNEDNNEHVRENEVSSLKTEDFSHLHLKVAEELIHLSLSLFDVKKDTVPGRETPKTGEVNRRVQQSCTTAKADWCLSHIIGSQNKSNSQ